MRTNRPFFLGSILLWGLAAMGCNRKSPPPAAAAETGAIVLLKSGATNAAFMITRQSDSPEVVDYIWFVRSDGKTTFSPTDSSVVTGSVTGAQRIAFASFVVDWSTAGGMGGYLYYPHQPRFVKLPWGQYAEIPFTGVRMAITTERDLTKVDGRDPRWKWRR